MRLTISESDLKIIKSIYPAAMYTALRLNGLDNYLSFRCRRVLLETRVSFLERLFGCSVSFSW